MASINNYKVKYVRACEDHYANKRLVIGKYYTVSEEDGQNLFLKEVQWWVPKNTCVVSYEDPKQNLYNKIKYLESKGKHNALPF